MKLLSMMVLWYDENDGDDDDDDDDDLDFFCKMAVCTCAKHCGGYVPKQANLKSNTDVWGLGWDLTCFACHKGRNVHRFV